MSKTLVYIDWLCLKEISMYFVQLASYENYLIEMYSVSKPRAIVFDCATYTLCRSHLFQRVPASFLLHVYMMLLFLVLMMMSKCQ